MGQPQQGQWAQQPPPQQQWGQQQQGQQQQWPPQQQQWPPQQPPPGQWAPVAQPGWAEFDPSAGASEYPVDVRFTPEARIERYWGIPLLGMWFRALFVVPHIIVLAFLGLAVILLSLFTWIPLLATGRYPGWGYAIVGGYLRWYTRVITWLLLLSGTYPPFSGGPADDQHVRVRIDEDRPVGRFWGIPIIGFVIRVLILIPHLIVLYLLGILVYFLVLFAWLPVLMNGRQAGLVYTIVGGYLRWYTRVGAYLFLMSGPYPPFRLD